MQVSNPQVLSYSDENCFTNAQRLFDFLQLKKPPSYYQATAKDTFNLLIPYAYAKKMRKGDANDPLLLQVLSHQQEHHLKFGFNKEPLKEEKFQQQALIQKYQARALLMVTSACSMHCRYCFRKFGKGKYTIKEIEHAIQLIEHDESLHEIILSGGDPLVLEKDALQWIISRLNNIEHIKRVRIHSRELMIHPLKSANKLISVFAKFSKSLILVTHCNHANEIDKNFAAIMQLLKDNTSLTLLNQSVLLKGVNDQSEILLELCENLFEQGILPYYLHQLDKVQGSHYFSVSDKEALAIHQQLQAMLPGYLVPKLVREIPQERSKTLLF